MRIHRIFLTTLLLGMIIAFPLYCSADDDKVVISQDNYSTASEFETAINEAINKYDNFSIEYSDAIQNSTQENSAPIMFASPSALSSGSVSTYSAADTVLYRVHNVKNLKNSFGKDFLKMSGSPGITIGLSKAKKKTYSLEFGLTFNCSKKIIANATWGSTRESELIYQGTWKVPSKANGKKVKRGYLHMRPEYKVKKYTVSHKNFGTNKWIVDGTSTTKKACSVDVYKTYVYK